MFYKSDNIIGCDASGKRVRARLVGGKAGNLFVLRRSGFNVPPWCVISTVVFERLFRPHRGTIAAILSEIDFSDQQSLERATGRIQQVILDIEFPDSLVKELLLAVSDISPARSRLAVRSSVVGEDSDKNSFAGLMDSFLNVFPAELPQTVKKVWASAYSSRAIMYRHRKGIDPADVSTAVIVQEMVPSECSGILFTRDPENGSGECLISAGLGLGEGVVQNLVETDTYRVNPQTKEIRWDVRSKTERIDAIKKGGGIRTNTVETARGTEPALDDSQILKLAGEGERAETVYGCPQDMEWAYDAEGQLYILQSRPITCRAEAAPAAGFSVWDNSNIVESYPGITLPLTFSFIRQCYQVTLTRAALGLVAFKRSFGNDTHIFKRMIGLLDGRVYYNLLHWYKMLSYLPGFRRHKESWDQMIGISQKLDFGKSALSPINSLYSLARVVYILLFIECSARSFFRFFTRTYRKYKHTDFSRMNEHELAEIYVRMERDFGRRWHLTLYNDFCAMKYYDWLKKLCHRWGPEGEENIHNSLLCGEPDVESVKPIHALLKLASTVSADENYRNLFRQPAERIWREILSRPQYRRLRAGVSDYLEAYGDRGLEELKLENPTFRENPTELIELIKGYARGGVSIEAMTEQERRIRCGAEALMADAVKGPLRKALFRLVLRNARKSIACRENMRFARSRLYGVVRRLFRRMGELFAAEDLLESPRDLYYLTVDEVFSFIQGASVTQNLRGLVKLRKAEYAEFAGRVPAERIRVSGIPYLSSLGESVTGAKRQDTLKGIGCSSGVSQGTAWVVTDPKASPPDGEYILVAKSTDPGWVFLMIQSKGIVVEKGSVLSHTAIIGRELGIPTIVSVANATSVIPDGKTITINGGTGVVKCA